MSYTKKEPLIIGASSREATRQAATIASAKRATTTLFFTGHRPVFSERKLLDRLSARGVAMGPSVASSTYFYVTTGSFKKTRF